ncbi:hypothetical protein [Pelomonas sp. SE-A7]|uniref:hypothetical protein n=1 Tax=Pelomonas sp. SE-A7 TaxID=3054953 RepID=UPI00259CC2EE|nr:hypothetical protein [Pelomonas sp. SE-A7]MDM4768366.1 hypothetical protein [Pelomonas sp. SE-A7]
MRFAPSLRFFRKPPAPVIEHDPADLGTAFGMEASLEGDDSGLRSNGNYGLESERAGADSESPLAWLSRPRS